MKYVVGLILRLLGIYLLGLCVSILFYPVNATNKMIGIAYDASDKILNADNAIYNCEWFKQKKEDIEASKVQLDNAQQSLGLFMVGMPEDRSKWGFENATEYSRLNSVVLGIQNNLANQIHDYNARASMATRNIFADGVLPSYIDALTFIKK